jgi:putative ABC transport system permease protein
LARVLVRLLVPKADREYFLGDLEEATARDRMDGAAITCLQRGRSVARELTGAIQLMRGRRRAAQRSTRSRGDNMLQELMSNVRFGLRLMLRTPGFTVVALLTMALGIGANTAIFSLVNGVLLKPLPYPEAERIVYLMANNLQRGWSSFSISPLDFWDWQKMNRSTELLAAYRWTSVTYTGGDRPESMSALNVSEDYLPILGGEPVLGRGFSGEDLDPTREAVVLLSHGVWQSSFGSDPNVLGRSMTLDGEPTTIIGVVPDDWRHIGSAQPDLLLPLRPAEWWYQARGSHFLRGLARTSNGVSQEQAQADFSSVASSLEAEYPESNDGWGAVVTPLDEVVLGGARPQLMVLLASVGLVLIIACANVAQMTLARASVRGQEMAIRTALGAGRARVVKQVLAESLLLSTCGGLLGLALAFGSLKALVLGWPEILPRLEEVNINATVLLFTAVLSLVSGCLFGLFPALSVAGSNIGDALRRASWNVTGDASRRRFRAGLVVAEVGLAVILLVGSGLLVRSLLALQNVDPGFETANTLAFSTSLPQSRYPTSDEQRAYGDASLERLEAIPGVESVAITTLIPISGQDEIWGLEIEGRPQNGVEDEISALFYRISPDYFDTMGIPVLSGRGLTQDDREGNLRVAVVSESFANQHFPGERSLGKRVRFGGEDSPFWEIVGVVGDVQHYSVGRISMGQLYLPFPQRPDNNVSFVLKSAVPPLSLVGAFRDAIQTVDPNQPLMGISTMEQLIADDLSAPRFRTVLLGAFGLTALLLSVVGLYGVLSYTVSQRSREIGMRMALGAERSAILKLVLRDGVPLVLVGVGIGVAGAFAMTRVLASMLFGVGVRDPGVFVGAPLLLMSVATVAVLIPAIRATRVDPVKTLAAE